MKTFSKMFPILLLLFMVSSTSLAQINSIGGFEGTMPSYWAKGAEPTGATLTWDKEAFRSLGRSLKITKEATTDEAAWISENMADFWAPKHFKRQRHQTWRLRQNHERQHQSCD